MWFVCMKCDSYCTQVKKSVATSRLKLPLTLFQGWCPEVQVLIISDSQVPNYDWTLACFQFGMDSESPFQKRKPSLS